MKKIFKEAHKMAKEMKERYPEVDYRTQFGLYISYLLEEIKEEEKMREELEKLIEKFRIELHGDNQFKAYGKPSKAEIKILKENKAEIMEILKERKAEKEKKAEEKASKELQEKIALEESKKPLKVSYCNGEYLEGYQAFGYSAKLLEELGLAKWVSGWGYLVDDELIKALGKEFTYAQAKEFATPKIEKAAAEREEKQRAEQRRIETLIEQAKVLGHKVEVSRRIVDCDGSVEECSTDILVQYIDGNGKYSVERIHTH